MFKLKLTKKELEILLKHWQKNLEYGWDGTFGGYEENDKKFKRECLSEMKIGKRISDKLYQLRF